MTVKGARAVVGIAAGKGGVGKSTVTVNIALALAECGVKVGIIDADLYGPSIAMMLPLERQMQEKEGWIIPAKSFGIEYISLSLFKTGQEAAIVRAPIANQIIEEFLHHVAWSDLDLLLIDFPPGTGDIQLTLMQKASLQGAILVTTPQDVCLLDVKKAHHMFLKMQVPVLGIIENMSYIQLPDGNVIYPFGKKTVKAFAQEHQINYLGSLPLEDKVALCCDEGRSLFDEIESVAQKEIAKIARELFFILMQQAGEKVETIELVWKEFI